MLSTSLKGRKNARADGRGYAPDTARPPCEGVRKDAEGEYPNGATGVLKADRSGKFAGRRCRQKDNEETR